MDEIWKDIEGYDGLYQVSNLGRVKTFQFNKGRIMKGYKTPLGYMMVCLRKNGTPTKEFVHRLVAKTFIENPEDKPYVNHLDCNPSNNVVTNLEWCTQGENVRYCAKLGRCRSACGEDHPLSKLNIEKVREIKEEYDICHNYSEVGRHFNVNPGTIWAIINDKSWRGIV